VKVEIRNQGKIPAKQVTVCIHPEHSAGFVKASHGHLVRNGACWRITRIQTKHGHTIVAVVRSFIKHKTRVCSGITVEVRGVDYRKKTVCARLSAIVILKRPGVTG
jgi:hypothetical protein